ncbi:hypothetical protein E2C01_075366 [Portunus trituberculatus]|uniref:Uncharacterized protein n=1 Tax=Portunus trituberculatus TaxID=210409 RepID=A0A5B7IJY2_PORTR|nr:hypothetical protein [Portunus trituberculatus]
MNDSLDHVVLDVALPGSDGCWGQSCGDAVPVDSQLRALLILILKGCVGGNSVRVSMLREGYDIKQGKLVTESPQRPREGEVPRSVIKGGAMILYHN